MFTRRLTIFLAFCLLLLSALACALPFGNPAEVVSPAVETAEAAAQTASNAAQTAAAQASDLAGTAVALATSEGSEAVATIKALATRQVDQLKEKLASIEPNADGNYQVTLTENEVNTVLRVRQLLSGDLLGAGLQSQQVTFSDGRMTLSGSIIEPLPGQLRVSMRPTVVDGRLQLDIIEASVADREAPPEALDAAESAISGALGEALGYLPDGFQLQDITVSNGELTITGRKSDE